jgi:putative membrane protein insertion efficiency factor
MDDREPVEREPVERETVKRARVKRAYAKRALLAAINFYRRNVSPMSPPVCRFAPTCSRYALEAIEKYGALRGLWLALRRILKCHPFHKGGYDPVP